MTPGLAMALLVTTLASTTMPGQVAATDEADIPVRQVVLDIISFTRWPASRGELQLCVVGQPSHASGFFASELWSGPIPVRPQRVATGDERLATTCDVVYAGRLSSGEREGVRRRIAGRPVLTIGEPDLNCVESTMFCLQVVGAQISFTSNLDAIARSGVRLNPRVLMLGRRVPPASGGGR